ncbi:thioredoxin-dependent thiol peroxidase [Symmachiella macrocystis]|uniref:Thioredoxin-dependent thiol peroxidase n=1 Tax=Symmachiella macrocystis TaxID=2527985 RepID=A0A5C6BQN2_9PLAN|nr:redoxin domain-containing protein [Symmachiella macrocystis]TWU13526.1 thioredoxin-dependent thiol peroxidase [Symmachiella macrocystis]
MTETHDQLAKEYRPSLCGLPKIVWVIPAAAVLIVAAIVIRTTYGPLWQKDGSGGFQSRPAPEIVLLDQRKERHRTARYLGRRSLIVLFFDGQQQPEDVRQLALLRDAYPQIRAANTEIVAVSGAPSETIAQWGGGSIPFPILADVDYAVHKQWGVSVPETGPLVPVMFLVDISGVIRDSLEFDPPDSPLDLPKLLDQLARLQ